MNNSGQTPLAIAPAPDETASLRETMSPFELRWPGTPWPPAEMKRLIELYSARPLFDDTSEWLIRDNPYRRPIDRESTQHFDFSQTIKKPEALGASALAAHRMLLNIYETDPVGL